MTLARSEREWAILVNEYNICKKKLNSKREALKILTSDLELCQRERDIYKTKIKQLLKEVDDFKRKEKEQENKEAHKSSSSTPVKKRGSSFSGNSVWEQELQNVRERKQKTLSQLLCESRGENKALKKDLAEIRQLYHDSQEDILLLRDVIAKQKNRINSIKDEDGDSLDSRQDLISQLEKSQEKMLELERDKMAISDEKAEISTERDHYKDKSGRLNMQLNFILGADDRRLVDIDSVLMENRYLKEQIKQLKEEKSMAVSALARYKNTFEKRKNKILQSQFRGSVANTAKHAVPSLISDLVGHLSSSTPPSTVADLQFLANSLSETLSEKDTALQHLRSANKILGHRVAELEKKLKTLEVSGLWSLQGHRGYGSTEADKLSKEVITGKRQALIPDEERRENGHNKDQDVTTENAERVRDTNSPSSPGWGVAPRSPTFDLSSFQGEVEEGLLVNVSGGPGDELEELACSEVGDVTENDDELDEEKDGHESVDARSDSTNVKEREDKSCNDEEVGRLDLESCVDSNGNRKNDSSHPSSPELYERDQVNNDIEGANQEPLPEAELAQLLKTTNAPD